MKIDDASAMVPHPLVEKRDDGHVTLTRAKGNRFSRPILRWMRVGTLTVNLDGLGSEVWRQIDGKRSVGAILARLEAKFPEESDLAARLGVYLSELVAARLMRLR